MPRKTCKRVKGGAPAGLSAGTNSSLENSFYDLQASRNGNGSDLGQNILGDEKEDDNDNGNDGIAAGLVLSKQEEKMLGNFERPIKPEKCQYCGETYDTKLSRFQHVRKCGDKRFLCDYAWCPFASRYGYHREYHMSAHTGRKTLRCRQCGYLGITKQMLVSHMSHHTDVFRFRCATCSFATKQKSQLSQHLSRHGHVPGPVLDENGSLPDSEAERNFFNYIRAKKRKERPADSDSRRDDGIGEGGSAKRAKLSEEKRSTEGKKGRGNVDSGTSSSHREQTIRMTLDSMDVALDLAMPKKQPPGGIRCWSPEHPSTDLERLLDVADVHYIETVPMD